MIEIRNESYHWGFLLQQKSILQQPCPICIFNTRSLSPFFIALETKKCKQMQLLELIQQLDSFVFELIQLWSTTIVN